MSLSLKVLASTFTLATLAMVSIDAMAADARVRCEVRADRSKISVDGRNLGRGRFSTQAVSGPNSASAPAQRAVRGQVETDYSSQPDDIAAGAVAISADFIVNATVTGSVLDSQGNVVASETVACRRR